MIQMNIRCQCGNEVTLQTEKDHAWLDRAWYNEERNKLECPRCKEKTLPLPLELLDAAEDGPVKVKVDAFRTVNLTRKRY